jgi:hypothetical protein
MQVSYAELPEWFNSFLRNIFMIPTIRKTHGFQNSMGSKYSAVGPEKIPCWCSFFNCKSRVGLKYPNQELLWKHEIIIPG